MIVAITGGRGFIGKSLADKHLAEGDQVRILSRQARTDDRAEWHIGDLADPNYDLRRFVEDADLLYHCAGEIRDTGLMEQVHIRGTRRLIASARGRIGRWIQLSSVGVYGAKSVDRVVESSPLEPVGAYEATKCASDQLVVQAFAERAFEMTILRPSIVFGPEMRNQSLLQWISMIHRGLFCFIGSPGASANYVDVENVVAALRLAAIHPCANGEVFNLSDWRTIEQFVASICNWLERPIPRLRIPKFPLWLAANCLQFAPRPILTPQRLAALSTRTCYPIDKIQNQLGYSHVMTMEAGLERLVKSWRELILRATA